MLDNTNNMLQYLKDLKNVRFYGQVDAKKKKRSQTMPGDIRTNNENLSTLLCELNTLLRETYASKAKCYNGLRVFGLVRKLAKYRLHEGEDLQGSFDRLWKDYKRFVEFYKNLPELPQDLKNTSDWGCWTQLISGKIIGDLIDVQNGPLDPIFGALLYPTAGQLSSTPTINKDTVHFHKAVYDAFDYLQRVHGTGPGVSYIKNNLNLVAPTFMFWKSIKTGRYRSGTV